MNMLLPYVDKMVSAYLDVSPQSPEVATTVARYEVTRGFRRFSGRCLSTKVPTRHFLSPEAALLIGVYSLLEASGASLLHSEKLFLAQLTVGPESKSPSCTR